MGITTEEPIDGNRLPPISASLVLETVGLEVFRDKFGMRQCLENGVGPRRKKLGPVPAQPPILAGASAELIELTMRAAMEIARDEARVLLLEMCRSCPFEVCKMKVWGVMRVPSG